MYRKSVFSGVLISLAGSIVFAQQHFKGVSNTGNNATVAAPASANPAILGALLATGDEIGVFTPGGLCAGSVVWEEGKNAAIIAWGDNDQTQEIDGLRAGETIRFCLWRKSSRIGYSDVSAAFAGSDGVYTPNGIYVLSSLNANAVAVPSTPLLSSPANGVTGITIIPRLAWFTVCGATSYAVQIDDDQNFSTPVVDASGVDSTGYLFSSVEGNSTYYWRVRGQNAAGESDWSSARTFTTGEITDVENLSSAIPDAYRLEQNFPNPFNAFTWIGFRLPSASLVTLKVYDLLGHEVATVIAEKKAAGVHRVRFDASALASGIYFYRLEARQPTAKDAVRFAETKKLILIK